MLARFGALPRTFPVTAVSHNGLLDLDWVEKFELFWVKAKISLLPSQ